MAAACALAPAARADEAASAALFVAMAPVLQSPRCVNCHTATTFPEQGDDRHRHIMAIVRGTDGHGAPSLQCQACHRAVNSAAGVPGAPDWHLAPLSMAWEGLSAAELCRSLFDPAHGAMQPAQFIAHLHTDLVQWAWSPGVGLGGHERTPPPMPRDQFLALASAWIAAGAACPAAR